MPIPRATWLAGLFLLSGCYSASDVLSSSGGKKAHINNKTKFSSSAYGVAASPRLTTSKKVRKGGGRRQVGKPYKIRGKWYTPREEPGYDKTGTASWYGPNFHGRLTANGEIYDQYALSGAHPTFPLPSYARVTNLANGRAVTVRINDRGPYHGGRIIDLSARAAKLLDYQNAGTARVRVQYVGQAPLHGLDEKYLAASYSGNGGRGAPVSPPVVATRNLADGPVPPGKLPSKPYLDTLSTGSVQNTEDDPFLNEVSAVEKDQDTGSTLALRFKQFLRANEAAK